MSVILSILIGLSSLSILFGFILLIIVYTSPVWLMRFYLNIVCKSGTVTQKNGESCTDLVNSVCTGEGDKGKWRTVIATCKDSTTQTYDYTCTQNPPNCKKSQAQIVSSARIVMWSCLWGGIGLLFILEIFSQHYLKKREKHKFILAHLKSQLEAL